MSLKRLSDHSTLRATIFASIFFHWIMSLRAALLIKTCAALFYRLQAGTVAVAFLRSRWHFPPEAVCTPKAQQIIIVFVFVMFLAALAALYLTLVSRCPF